MASKAEDIFKAAFHQDNPRDKRSLEYKMGVMAALLNAENVDNIHYERKTNPYPEGSAARDAWWAGISEEKRLWQINSEMRG